MDHPTRASQPAILTVRVRRWDAPLPALGMVNTSMVSGYNTITSNHMLHRNIVRQQAAGDIIRPKIILTTPMTCAMQRPNDFNDHNDGHNRIAETGSEDSIMMQDNDALTSPPNLRFLEHQWSPSPAIQVRSNPSSSAFQHILQTQTPTTRMSSR
jgi:hypothetical protein